MTTETAAARPESAELLEAGRLLSTEPAQAESLVRGMLAATPAHPGARLLLAAALRAQHRPERALDELVGLASEQRQWPGVHYQLGVVLGDLGRQREAIDALATAHRLSPELPGLWRALGDQHLALGDTRAAEEAYTRHLQAATWEPLLVEARQAARARDWQRAAQLLRIHLAANPGDVLAVMLQADVELAAARLPEAAALFEQVLRRVPSHLPARCGHAMVHIRSRDYALALRELEDILVRVPEHHDALSLKATALSQIGDSQSALDCYQRVLQINDKDAVVWMCYGNMLRTLGLRAESIAAFRKCLAIRGSYGEAYWSLANLKTYRFDDQERQQMERALGDQNASPEDKVHLHFAIARAHEDAGEFALAFQHYAAGNALWRQHNPYESRVAIEFTRRSKAVLTAQFFRARAGAGSDQLDPIFIVGMPRSGSTLLEQILASHSEVEGTLELTEILALVAGLSTSERGTDPGTYPAVLASMRAEEFQELGTEFIERTRIFRRLGRTHFIDKMPNNFLHCGLLHLILPRARIIDIRRHPLACCWSNFKQHFARGQGFADELVDLGVYYRQYVELMAHYDAVLPGRVHRVIYERLVTNPEHEIRRLLDYCQLPFQRQCLRFYETQRPVWTPSSEQVRRPFYADELQSWRSFEPWLDPLKGALGAVLDAYPEVPEF